MHCFLGTLRLHNPPQGWRWPIVRRCRRDLIDGADIRAVVVVLKPLADAFPPCLHTLTIKAMQPVTNVVQLAYLRTTKWITRLNTTRVRVSIYTQKYNALLRRRPLPRLEIFPTYHHVCQIRKHRLYLFCTLWKSAWPLIRSLLSHTLNRGVTHYLSPRTLHAGETYS